VRLWAALAAASLLASAGLARAEPQPEPKSHEPSPKRPIPDYDGRGPKPAPPGDAALWPLRIVLSPLYFVSEYVLRRPLGAITRAAERAKVPEKLYDFFAFGPDHKIGFAPAGFIEFGFNPSVGIWGFWDDAFVKDNHVRLHYEVWPDDWLAGTITDLWNVDPSHSLEFRVSGFTRPDQVFYGLGPESAQFNQSRYTESRFDASGKFTSFVWHRTRVEAQAGVRKVDLSPGHYGSDPSLEQEARTGVFPIPFGFNRGYLAPYGRVLASFDTRQRHVHEGSGFRLQAQGEGGADVEHSPASGWIRWGGAATAFVDLNQHGRVFSVAAAASFADPVGDEPIPFTELVMLGGDNWLHGFFPGRFYDRSAAVAQLEYNWPVGPWIDGTLQGALGNVFGEHLSGFDAKLLRVSAGFGLSIVGDPPVQLLLGLGTDTLDRGATIDSFRVSFGIPRSF
jgi:hypothetical protein